MNYKIAQLILTPGKNASTVCDIFVAQVDSHKEQLAGKLFILIEAEGNRADSVKMVNFLIDSLNRNYYQNEKILLRERISALKIEHIFEAALARTNKNFFEYLKNGKIKIDKIKLNIVAGIIQEKDIYISGTGCGKAFLIYRTDGEEKSAPYKAVDLLLNSEKATPEKQTKGKESSSDEKLFSSVINGTLPPRSYFFACNEALPEYISKRQMIETISVLPPAGAIEQIKQSLENINSYVSFLGLLIKSPETAYSQIPEIQNFSQKTAQESIINLNKTEDNTETLLSGSRITSGKKWLNLIVNFFTRGRENIKNSKTSPFGLKDKILFKRKDSLLSKISLLLKMLTNIFKHILRVLSSGFKSVGEKTPAVNLPIKGKNLFAGIGRIPKSFFSSLSTKRKILFVLILTVAGILIFNLLWQRNLQKKEALEKDYSETIAQIEQKQNQAEANMLFSNEARAIELYEEIKNLIESLPQKSDEQILQYSEFTEKYEEFLERSRRIFPFSGLEKLINLNDLLPEASADNIIFDPNSSRVYAADSALESLYIFDTKDKLGTILSGLEQSIEKLDYPVLANDGRIYYFNRNGLIIFDPEASSLTEVAINLNGGEAGGSDIYNNRLYAVDKTNNQILRYNLGSLNSPYSWIQDDSAPENIKGISIDGNIYLATASGEVIKYLRGEALDFKLESIDPPLQSADKIIAEKNGNFIYILENGGNRIIIYDKDGQFQRQYRNKDITELKDFVIDENERILYFLAGNSIYKANLDIENE